MTLAFDQCNLARQQAAATPASDLSDRPSYLVTVVFLISIAYLTIPNRRLNLVLRSPKEIVY